MAASRGVPLSEATPSATPPAKSPNENPLKMVVATPEPISQEEIAPDEPRNTYDIDNPSDFEAYRRAFPPQHQTILRRSKRQAGYSPDFSSAKKPRTATFIMDPDFSSRDDYDDGDFELVARSRDSGAAKKIPTTPSATSTPDLPEPQKASGEPTFSSEDEQSLADFLNSLRETKKGRDSVQKAGKAHLESSEKAPSKSEAMSEAERSNNSSKIAAESGGDDEGTETSVGIGVANTDSEDYNLGTSFSTKFYFESVLGQWFLYAHREFVEERNIDFEAYEKYNLTTFHHTRRLSSKMNLVIPYSRRPVLEFYCNLTSSVGDRRSAKLGHVFVRDAIYDFSPYAINDFYNTTADDDSDELPSIDFITYVLTGGLITVFPSLPKWMAAKNLTSFYSMLQKTDIRNWTPSTNSTVVSRPQAITLFKIGTGRPFNFGQLVFNTILQFAEGGLKSTKLPFPSLIYSILESQGFVPEAEDQLVNTRESLKIAHANFKGNRIVDLPWSATGVSPNVGNTASSSSSTPAGFI